MEPAKRSEFSNGILSKLPASQLDTIRHNLFPVKLVAAQMLYEDMESVDAIYFMEEGIAALIADTGDGGTVQVGMVGSEGFVGTDAMFDGEFVSSQRAIMQGPGSAFRLERRHFQHAVAECVTLRELCLRHVQALMMQIAQSAACNAAHILPQRLTRLLLMLDDRSVGGELRLTQDDLATMLQSRRPGISIMVCVLQEERVVEQRRGRISIVDRAALEARSCACYRILKFGARYVMDGERPWSHH